MVVIVIDRSSSRHRSTPSSHPPGRTESGTPLAGQDPPVGRTEDHTAASRRTFWRPEERGEIVAVALTGYN